MKPAHAVLAICFGVQTSIVVGKKVRTQDSQGSLVAGNCGDHRCSAGWVPKTDHYKLTTNSSNTTDEACCMKTCELFVNRTGCATGYLPNPAYARNVEYSSQKCCDRTCQDDFQCTQPGYKSKGPTARGHSVAECCGPTCSIYECPSGWVSSSDSTTKLGHTHEDCCDATCAVYECPPGFSANVEATNTTGNTTSTCCLEQCSNFTGRCATGYEVPGSRNSSLGNNETCCAQQCGHLVCELGYDANTSKALEFGETSSECCIQTCALYNCSGNWANSTNVTKLAGHTFTAEACCEASCSAYSCSDGWLPNEENSALAGASDSACCSRTCFLHTCPNNYRKRNSSAINGSVAESDDFCCEPAGCENFDNLTALNSSVQCSDLGQDECNSKYVIANTSNMTALIQCMWHQIGNSSIYTCRTWGTPVFDCTASM